MSSNTSDAGDLRMAKLTGRNFPEWIEHIKDYINTLEADDAPEMWNAYE